MIFGYCRTLSLYRLQSIFFICRLVTITVTVIPISQHRQNWWKRPINNFHSVQSPIKMNESSYTLLHHKDFSPLMEISFHSCSKWVKQLAQKSTCVSLPFLSSISSTSNSVYNSLPAVVLIRELKQFVQLASKKELSRLLEIAVPIANGKAPARSTKQTKKRGWVAGPKNVENLDSHPESYFSFTSRKSSSF